MASPAQAATFRLKPGPVNFRAYAVDALKDSFRAGVYPAGGHKESQLPSVICSLGVIELSNHERMVIMGSS